MAYLLFFELRIDGHQDRTPGIDRQKHDDGFVLLARIHSDAFARLHTAIGQPLCRQAHVLQQLGIRRHLCALGERTALAVVVGAVFQQVIQTDVGGHGDVPRTGGYRCVPGFAREKR